ncbi:hypothetical protein I302_100816 [Kwoniella bestiolae CBS 10118]|uniref:Uncharacterized protein n=1 Tax=Kwoniella bestiolae CBS 10118 TaxID=1296100 RepID=A0A1B9G672_9TREE|nr:hypothetical protein I302_04189 [Kwoniella bestiolae CBS 10118]OCF26503.1 hypothetical protein I302_04189 [Kwoniella bestiolae CBS 10118]
MGSAVGVPEYLNRKDQQQCKCKQAQSDLSIDRFIVKSVRHRSEERKEGLYRSLGDVDCVNNFGLFIIALSFPYSVETLRETSEPFALPNFFPEIGKDIVLKVRGPEANVLEVAIEKNPVDLRALSVAVVVRAVRIRRLVASACLCVHRVTESS